MAPGDIRRESEFFLLSYSKAATADIAKGDIVTLSAGRSYQANDVGPFGVATRAIANGADMKGRVLIDGVVSVLAGDAIAQFKRVYPSGSSKAKEVSTQTAELWLGSAMKAAAADGNEIDVDL